MNVYSVREGPGESGQLQGLEAISSCLTFLLKEFLEGKVTQHSFSALPF